MIEIEELVRLDLWKAIKQHYIVEDYTESLRDAAFLIKDILQNKSGEYDKDNVKLVDAVLLGTNPILKINNYSTQSEKDFQLGIAYGIKGIFSHVRNPISHDKIIYSVEEADAILLYINYLISQIDKSKSTTLVTEWLPLLMNETFTDTEEYAKELIQEVPKKRSFELLVELYRQKNYLPRYRLTFFIRELVNKLTENEKAEFVKILNSELLQSEGGDSLAQFFHYFAPYFYKDLKKVVKLRIEDIVYHAIKEAELVEGNAQGINAAMATWANNCIISFETKEKVIKLLRKKVFEGQRSMDYVLKWFEDYVDLGKEDILKSWKSDISSQLIYNENAYIFVRKFIWDKKSKIYLELKEQIDKYEEQHIAVKDRIPEEADWF